MSVLLSLRSTLLLALSIRLILLCYGIWQDANLAVKYTDIDYVVFTDAARYMTQGGSPYQRATYRYTPIIAWILQLNIYVHPVTGKLFFIVADLLAGLLIYLITRSMLGPQENLQLKGQNQCELNRLQKQQLQEEKYQQETEYIDVLRERLDDIKQNAELQHQCTERDELLGHQQKLLEMKDKCQDKQLQDLCDVFLQEIHELLQYLQNLEKWQQQQQKNQQQNLWDERLYEVQQKLLGQPENQAEKLWSQEDLQQKMEQKQVKLIKLEFGQKSLNKQQEEGLGFVQLHQNKDEVQNDQQVLDCDSTKGHTLQSQVKEKMHLIEKQNKEQGDQLKVTSSSITPLLCCQLWLFNPLLMTISTRGNAESVVAVLLMIVMYSLRRCKDGGTARRWMVLGGLCYGVVVHMRIYPAVYALPIYLYINWCETRPGKSSKTILETGGPETAVGNAAKANEAENVAAKAKSSESAAAEENTAAKVKAVNAADKAKASESAAAKAKIDENARAIEAVVKNEAAKAKAVENAAVVKAEVENTAVGASYVTVLSQMMDESGMQLRNRKMPKLETTPKGQQQLQESHLHRQQEVDLLPQQVKQRLLQQCGKFAETSTQTASHFNDSNQHSNRLNMVKQIKQFHRYTAVFPSFLYYVLPTLNSFLFAVAAALAFTVTTGVCYMLYGDGFLQETYLYHVTRRDHRHNFSAYFYFLYLFGASGHSATITDNATAAAGSYQLIISLLSFLPQVMLLLLISVLLYRSVEFACFAQTFIFVMFNKVCTSQYFCWYLCLLPLVLPNLRLSLRRSLSLCALWIVAQGLWLFAAYLLEFQSYNTFLYIWIASLLFLLTNAIILQQLLSHFTPIAC